MEPLLLFPDPAPPEIAQALDMGGFPWKSVASAEAAARLEPEDGWAGAIVCADIDAEGAFALCRALRKRDIPMEPLLLLVGGARTVDVHVRRLRAKLGEEHAGLISTVRSVGYRFGETRWSFGRFRQWAMDVMARWVHHGTRPSPPWTEPTTWQQTWSPPALPLSPGDLVVLATC